jgi:soluble lytic murein transglycosylase-like protein
MALSRQFDPLFSKHAGDVPVNFLRALAKRESNFNPKETGGSYWGILQVGFRNVLPSYNKRRGTNFSANDLLNPDINIMIAADLLNRIPIAYAKHPDPNMKPDWSNPEFVKLVLAGWNSGYSEGGGVGKVARYLESRGIPVTHDAVFANAAAAGATKHLSSTAKQRWQRGVASLFYQEGGPGFFAGSRGRLKMLGLVAGAGFAVYALTPKG